MNCPLCGGRITVHWRDGIELRCEACIARASEMRERIVDIRAIVVKAVQEALDEVEERKDAAVPDA